MNNWVLDLEESMCVYWTNSILPIGAGAAVASVASGDVVKIGSLFGVAADTIALAASGKVVVGGRAKLNKATGVTYAVGRQLGYDFTNKRVTTDLSGGVAGVVTKAAVTGDTVVHCNLNPRPRRFSKRITPSAGEAVANTMNVDCGFPTTNATVMVQAVTTAGVPIALGHVIVPTAGAGNENKITIDYTDIVASDQVNVIVEEAIGVDPV